MAIPPAGQFDYHVHLKRRFGGAWGGRAMASTEPEDHPGLVGRRPRVELSGGRIILRRTESIFRFLIDPHYRSWGRPRARWSIAVGPLFERLVEHGDMLRLHRGATGEDGAVLSRGGALIMALGAVGGILGAGYTFREDPRATEVDIYDVRDCLEDPSWSVVWLDTATSDFDTLAGLVAATEGDRLVLAIAGKDRATRMSMNHRLGATGQRGACRFVDVDERFTTQEMWEAYIRQLPQRRPSDLHIRFQLGGVSRVVLEHEYAFEPPWHLFVETVYTPGLPGELSQVAIVHEHPGVTRELVIESARTVASGGMAMR